MLANTEVSQQITQSLHVFWIASLVSLLTGTMAWRQGFFQWEPSKAEKEPVRGKDVFKAFLYFVLIQIFLIPAAVVVVFTLLTGEVPTMLSLTASQKGWINIAAILGGFVGVAWVFARLPRYQQKAIWGDSSKWMQHIAIGLAAWFVSYPLVLAFNQLVSIAVLFIFREPAIDQVAVRHFRHLIHEPVLFWATALLVVLVVPVVEELLFRGFLQSWLKNKLAGTKRAILATSVIFALFHFSVSQGITNIELLSSLFILSCFLGFLYEKQGSLWASIGLHACFNALSVLMIMFD